MPQLTRQLLQKGAIFDALSNDALDFLLQRTDEIAYAPGDHALREPANANVNAMFIIESGKAVVLKCREGKHHRKVATNV